MQLIQVIILPQALFDNYFRLIIIVLSLLLVFSMKYVYYERTVNYRPTFINHYWSIILRYSF